MRAKSLKVRKSGTHDYPFYCLLTIIIHILTGIIIILRTIVQTSKLATWQKNANIYSPAGLIVRHIMK